jgi:phenolic acid decarboxylase
MIKDIVNHRSFFLPLHDISCNFQIINKVCSSIMYFPTWKQAAKRLRTCFQERIDIEIDIK